MEFLPGHWSRGRPRRGCAAAQPLGSAAFSCPRGQPAPSDALGAPPRAQSSAALGRRHRSWDQRQAALSAHDGGLVGQGRAPGLGFLQRAADATAGSRHTRPRGSQAAHAGERGGKMWVILRRIQRAHVCRSRRAGGRATSAAVRSRCDAMAGSRHTRPRGSQGAHAGPRGGKMRAILRRIQRAYFRRHRRTGSCVTPVAVRLEHARRTNGRVFHTKTFATWAGSQRSQ